MKMEAEDLMKKLARLYVVKERTIYETGDPNFADPLGRVDGPVVEIIYRDFHLTDCIDQQLMLRAELKANKIPFREMINFSEASSLCNNVPQYRKDLAEWMKHKAASFAALADRADDLNVRDYNTI